MFFIGLMVMSRNSGVDASKPRIYPKKKICEKCGDEGDQKCLIYCVQCQVSAEHSYCLEKLNKEDDGTVSWRCEECTPNVVIWDSEQLRKSERINQAIEAKYNRMKKQKERASAKIQKSVNFSIHEHADMGGTSKAERSDYLQRNDIGTLDQNLTRKKRKLVLEDENFTNEELISLNGPSNISSDQLAPGSQKNVYSPQFNNAADQSKPIKEQGLQYSKSHNCGLTKPLIDPIWRGQCRVDNTTSLGLAAHLSSKACSKVHCAVTGLPPLLDVELLSRFDIWPQSFKDSPPTDGSIALYIFPEYDRDENAFDGVVNNLIEQDLALKAVVKNVELLIFSSRLLPAEHWRICRKYYLWGVFRPTCRIETTHNTTSPLGNYSS